MRVSKLDFIREQGYPATSPDDDLYSAAMLQPRIIGVVTVIGVLLQSGWLFTALGGVLLWSALAPTHNPFDALYNVAIARPRSLARLPAAPAPRRFAMALAGTMALVMGVALLARIPVVAWPLEVMFVLAVAAIVLTNRCAGAALYHALHRATSPSSTPSAASR